MQNKRCQCLQLVPYCASIPRKGAQQVQQRQARNTLWLPFTHPGNHPKKLLTSIIFILLDYLPEIVLLMSIIY